MHRARSTIIALLTIIVCSSASVGKPASGQDTLRIGSPVDDQSHPHQTPGPQVQVTLSAPNSTTSWDDRDPDRETFTLPLLYLHRQRSAATEADRTLDINLSGSVGGTEIEIEAISQHVDVSTGQRHTVTGRFPLPNHPCTQDHPCTVRWAFDASTMLSDLYTLHIKDATGRLLWQNPHPDRPDFVILDTWDVNPGEYAVRVFYATLFPFARGQTDLDNRLSPAAVTDFIEHHFVPLILENWQTQFHTWGFGPIHPAWDRDKVVEIFVTDPPFALFGGTGTYTISVYGNDTPYPERRLWWFSSNKSFREYDSLENAYRVVFSHEFFHLAQWNAMLSAGCSTKKWTNVFIEAQAKFAPSVQYPELELLGDHSIRANSTYLGVARRFLQLRLNTSYQALEEEKAHLYDTALYWRFLYEQFGDMGVIRAALEEMACGYGPDIVASLDDVLDSTLARFEGPLQTFEESLVAFAQANYALRLENGRCLTIDPGECKGRYYDPYHKYTDHPSLEAELYHSGHELVHHGAIGASFGMDFVQVHLEPALHGQPLSIALQSEGARFSAQIWKLRAGDKVPTALTQHPEPMKGAGGNQYTYNIPSLDTTEYDMLALIITRLDPGESTGTTGNYHLTLDSSSHVFVVDDNGIAAESP
jgi:hypothetical protein